MASPATGQAPYGFRWQGRSLTCQENEAHIRRLMFELFEQHGSKGAVARILNEQGFRTRRGSMWSDVAVSRQLTCPSAIGVYAINKTTTDESGRRIERSKEEWNFVECEQIISKALWDHVQSILEDPNSKRPPSGKTPRPTFAGILRCSCGGTMAILSGSSKYACRKCDNRIPSADLEEIFLRQLENLIDSRSDLFEGPSLLDESSSEAMEKLSEAQTQLSETRRSMTKFEQLFAAGELTLERFSEVHGPLQTKCDALNKKVSRLRSVAQADNSETEKDEEQIDFRFLVDHWPELSLEDKHEVVTSLLTEIIIGNGEIEFRYSFPENLDDSSKDTTTSQQTENPTNEISREPGEPLYIRLPSPGSRCELTGMSRSKLNELILPNDRNSYVPPVESFAITRPGQTKGTRLIVWQSLKSFLESQRK